MDARHRCGRHGAPGRAHGTLDTRVVGTDRAVALVGDVVSIGMRRAARRDLAQVFAVASDKARSAGTDVLQRTAREPFELVPLKNETVERFIDRFTETAVWVDEGNCFNRAMLGAHMLDDMVGLGAGPTDDAFAAGIAINRYFNAAGYDSGFHAAVALRPKGSSETMVVDLLPGHPRIEKLSSWSSDPDPMLLRPFAGTGLWNGTSHRSEWVGHQYFDFARSQLDDTWRAAEDHGVRVRLFAPAPR